MTTTPTRLGDGRPSPTTSVEAEARRLAGAPKPVPFTTVLAVEARKMLDTRAGIAVVATILAIATAILGYVVVFRSDTQPDFSGLAAAPMQGVLMLTPVVLILAMAGEWTQRTALTTFTLVPRRGRVLLAKFLAGIGVVAAVTVVALALTAVATFVIALLHGGTVTFAGWTDVLRSNLVIGVLTATMAAAIAALVANTAVALVAFFVAPTVFSVLSMLVLKSAAPWFDIFSAFERLSGSDPWADLPKTLTATAIWVVVPTVLGVVRSLRREVK